MISTAWAAAAALSVRGSLRSGYTDPMCPLRQVKEKILSSKSRA